MVGRTVAGAVMLETLIFNTTSNLTFAVLCRLQLHHLVWGCGEAM